MNENTIGEEIAFGLRWELPIALPAARWLYPGSSVFRCADKAGADFVVVQHNVTVAFFEVKYRRCKFSDFEDTMVPLEKHTVGRFTLKLLRVPTYYLAYFSGDNVLAAINLATFPSREEMVHRTGRPKPVAHCFYALKDFEILPVENAVLREFDKLPSML